MIKNLVLCLFFALFTNFCFAQNSNNYFCFYFSQSAFFTQTHNLNSLLQRNELPATGKFYILDGIGIKYSMGKNAINFEHNGTYFYGGGGHSRNGFDYSQSLKLNVLNYSREFSIKRFEFSPLIGIGLVRNNIHIKNPEENFMLEDRQTNNISISHNHSLLLNTGLTIDGKTEEIYYAKTTIGYMLTKPTTWLFPAEHTTTSVRDNIGLFYFSIGVGINTDRKKKVE